MAILKYYDNGSWIPALNLPNATDTTPGLIKVYNDLDMIDTGYALDASQGKILQDQIDNLSNDFIVEQGTNGIWTYRKWNSGIAECWGIDNRDWAITSTYGSLYYTSRSTSLPSGLFTSITNVLASRGGDGGNGLITVSVNSVSTSTLGFYVFDGRSATTNAGISFHVIGRWK